MIVIQVRISTQFVKPDLLVEIQVGGGTLPTACPAVSTDTRAEGILA